MRFSTSTLSFTATLSVVAAQYKGFNYGSTMTDGSAKTQAYFESEFAAANVLQGASGFTSARLYTTIQAGTTNTPIAAIPAAIAQKTNLLLGLWASGGQADLTNEIEALTAAITQYGTDFTNLVIGISVGSEDLYRTSTTGIAAMAGVGTTPDVLVSYIGQVRSAIASTALSSAKITHVDTFNAWTNGSNSAVIDAVDFLSMDAYPYFQNTMTNAIENGAGLFESAYDETVAVAGNKEVWVTETGWPVSGPTENLAVASVANAQTYWDDVGCNFLFGKVNTFWYILQDAVPTLPSPSFGLVGVGSVDQAPLFNLTCPAVSSSAAVAAAVVPSSTAVAPFSTAAVSGSTSAASSATRVPLVAASAASPSSAPAVAASSAAAKSGVDTSVASSVKSSAPAASSTVKTSTAKAASSSSTTAAAQTSGATVQASTSGSDNLRVAQFGISLAGLLSFFVVLC